jgi:hypothetical protein
MNSEKLLLSELTDQGGMNGNILPKRKGQLFFEHSMDPFHCGMQTFFACEAIGNYSKDGEEDGLLLLLKDGLESGSDEENKYNKEDISRLMHEIVKHGFKNLRSLRNANMKNTLVTVACSLRQSRFDTYSRERTAPLVEMSYKQHNAMESNGGVCMHALVPLSHDGLIVQFFYNRDDNNGTLIKIMPTTILLFPSTAIMEYGRLTHINGHRHLLIKVLYTKNPKDGQPAISLKDSIQEYPHLSATMNGMEAKNGKMPDGWEREF